MNIIFTNKTKTELLNNTGNVKRLFAIKHEKAVMLSISTNITAKAIQFSDPTANI